MKFPRLELRWRKSDTKKDGDMAVNYDWACDYVLVIFPATVSDMRSNKYDAKGNEKFCAKNVEYILNTSYRGGGGSTPYAGDTPFRDGAHAAWDSTALNLPVYSVYDGKSKRVPVNPRSAEMAKSRLDGTDPGLRKNRKKNDLTD